MDPLTGLECSGFFIPRPAIAHIFPQDTLQSPQMRIDGR
jgi:hypothetical protein